MSLHQSKIFPSPEALKDYLQDHPKADPGKHTVRKEPSKVKDVPSKAKDKDVPSKDLSIQKGFEPLKDLSPKEQREVVQKALLNLETEQDEAKDKGKSKGKSKDVSDEKGFEVLKGLSPEAQRKLIQRALGEKKASADFWDLAKVASFCPSCAMSLLSAGLDGVYRSEVENLVPRDRLIAGRVLKRYAKADEFLTVEEIADICPTCAFEMVTAGLQGAYKSDLHRMIQAAKWNKLPNGWTEDSVKEFWDSLTGDRKHKVTACIKKMEGTEIDDPGAFCASLADKMEPGWRSEG